MILHIAHGDLHGALLPFGAVGAEFQGGIAQSALRLGHQGLGAVAAIDLRLAAAVFGRLLFGLLDQGLDLLLAEV